MSNIVINIKTGKISNGQTAIINNAISVFIKSKNTSQNDSIIDYLDDNDNIIGTISLEIGEKKTYNSSRGMYLPKIRITAGDNSTVEYEYM